MLIMRMHALYERSHKVLAFYIIIAVVIVIVGCVSFNFDGNHDLASYSISDLLVCSGRYRVEKKENIWMCRHKLAAVNI
jgi:hypothetical protein